MNNHQYIDERIMDIIENSESAIIEIVSNIAFNCDVSGLEKERILLIQEKLSPHIHKGILDAIRALNKK